MQNNGSDKDDEQDAHHIHRQVLLRHLRSAGSGGISGRRRAKAGGARITSENPASRGASALQPALRQPGRAVSFRSSSWFVWCRSSRWRTAPAAASCGKGVSARRCVSNRPSGFACAQPRAQLRCAAQQCAAPASRRRCPPATTAAAGGPCVQAVRLAARERGSALQGRDAQPRAARAPTRLGGVQRWSARGEHPP